MDTGPRTRSWKSLLSNLSIAAVFFQPLRSLSWSRYVETNAELQLIAMKAFEPFNSNGKHQHANCPRVNDIIKSLIST